MARARFNNQQRRFTAGVAEAEFAVADYAALRAAILARFPAMPSVLLDEGLVAIDGDVIHRPALEALDGDSEVVFIGQLVAG